VIRYIALKILRAWLWALCYDAAQTRYQIDLVQVDDLFDPRVDALRDLYAHDIRRIAEVEALIDRLTLPLGSPA